jgi:manganese oxidase
MMDMPMDLPPERLAKLNKRETRGMRRDWYTGLEGLMTVVRVLPPDLYDAVMSDKGEVSAGASTPGGGEGEANPHRHRN